MKKGDLEILGNNEIGYFIYEIGKPNPKYKMKYIDFDFRDGFVVYDMEYGYIGEFTSIHNVKCNLYAMHSNDKYFTKYYDGIDESGQFEVAAARFEEQNI